MKDATTAWTKCQNHLIAFTIEETETAVDNLPELTINDSNFWAARVIKHGRTNLSNQELEDFFKSSNNSTSAFFKIHEL